MRWSRSTGKKIGDAWRITLRYYGLLEYQGVGKERE
jgi:hypothetical protein